MLRTWFFVGIFTVVSNLLCAMDKAENNIIEEDLESLLGDLEEISDIIHSTDVENLSNLKELSEAARERS